MVKATKKSVRGKKGSEAHSRTSEGEDSPQTSATSVVLEEIKRRLRTGELVPGQRMVASELAEELQLSRVPVREALHVLSGEGIIDLQLNRSARIRPITAPDLIDMLRLLSALGGLSLSLAAERMNDLKQRAGMRVIIDEIVEALKTRNAARFFAAGDSFHSAINEIANNYYLRITYGHLHMDYFNRALAARLPGEHWEQFEDNYRAIGKALLAGDAKLARRSYEEHMEWAAGKLIQNETKPKATPRRAPR